MPFWPFGLFLRWVTRPRARWIEVRISARITELSRRLPALARLWPGLRRNLPTSLERLRGLTDEVLRDTRIDGVLMEIPPLAAGWAAATGLRKEISRMRAGGRRVVVYLPEGGNQRELFVASAADRVIIAPEAMVGLAGFSLESRYYRGLLDRLGVGIESLSVGRFKTATENLTRDAMSDAQREQLTAILVALDRVLVDALGERPGLDEPAIRALFDKGMILGHEAVAAGLCDAVGHADECARLVRGWFPGGAAKLSSTDSPSTSLRPSERLTVGARRYLSHRQRRFFVRVRKPPQISVINIHGVIAAKAGGLAPTGALLPVVRGKLRRAYHDPLTVGVILHINSPGGSSLASDLIHREIARLDAKKPVVACMADVAASGGYYVAAPTRAIVAEATTLTGSIGVVSAKLVLSALFSRFGIHTEVLKSAPHADMFSPARTFDDQEREIVQRIADQTYAGFVRHVASGRKMAISEVEKLAQGRVYSGRDALDVGLVDAIGGLDVAVAKVKALLPPEVAARVVVRRGRGATGDLRPPSPPVGDDLAKGTLAAAIGAYFDPRTRAGSEMSAAAVSRLLGVGFPGVGFRGVGFRGDADEVAATVVDELGAVDPLLSLLSLWDPCCGHERTLHLALDMPRVRG